MHSMGNSQETTLSQEQLQQFAQHLIQYISKMTDNELITMSRAMEGMTDNMISIDKDVIDLKEQLQQLRSGQISQNDLQEASDEVFTVIGSEETQKRIAKSVDQELVDKFKNLPPAKKALAKSGLIGAAGAITPIAIVGAAIAIPVALVALPLVLLYTGLKRAMPSKEKFQETWQEIKNSLTHDMKNLANKAPGETNLEKLWKSAHKPGVTAENPNLEEFLTKYCFPDQESGKEVKVKFDFDKIEALKATVKTIGLDLDKDIDRIVRKGESKFSKDYVNVNKDGIDTQFIATVDKIATAVKEEHLLPTPNLYFAGIQDIFESKLAEIKQTKAEEKAAKQENSFLNKIKSSFNKSSSHAESVEAGRGGSSDISR
ncbi:MAG: hypothetical protein sL5_04290 [Candidatus Mesenet longicola]|uniref:Uncharacterized protein n=1 Tax=Candidatus Mesenet longicola TaxID=1892558 RepID=A0A8J3HPG8_9RICK|nr:MAG: hypothetical protein sGL2_04040 [Candidatus Mesenet longicola]GHM59436.1 MAG: hypothetical protein sL5_04290 [Candidatus Mesenet longicola]